jgi:hypothetical protein
MKTLGQWFASEGTAIDEMKMGFPVAMTMVAKLDAGDEPKVDVEEIMAESEMAVEKIVSPGEKTPAMAVKTVLVGDCAVVARERQVGPVPGSLKQGALSQDRGCRLRRSLQNGRFLLCCSYC